MSVPGIRLAFEAFMNSRTHRMDAEELGVLTYLWFAAWEHRSAILPLSINATLLSDQLDCDANSILGHLAENKHIEIDVAGRINVLMSAETNIARFKKAKPPAETPDIIPMPLKGLEMLQVDPILCRDFGKLTITWKQRFPLIDLRKELIKANGWLTDNPDQKRPSKARFLANWFRKAQTTIERSWKGGAPATGKASLESWKGNG